MVLTLLGSLWFEFCSARRRLTPHLDVANAASMTSTSDEEEARDVGEADATCGSRASTGSCASLLSSNTSVKEEAKESFLPYFPKAYELYALAVLPLSPFLLLLLFLGPLLLDE